MNQKKIRLIMNIIGIIIAILMSITISNSVKADNYGVNCKTNQTLTNEILVPIYSGIGEQQTIIVYDTTSTDVVAINMNGSYYNFTAEENQQTILFTETGTPYDISYQLNKWTITEDCYNKNITIRYKQPYNLTISFYYQAKNGTEMQLLKDDFQYIGVKPKNSVISMKFAKLGSLGIAGQDKKTFDESEGYWAKYRNGEAKIKLYTTGQYQVDIINVDTDNGYVGNEFYYPQLNGMDIMTMTTITITNTSMASYIIKLNPVEKLFSKGILNVLYWAIVIILWAGVVGFTAYITQNGQITVAVAVAGLPIISLIMGVIF